MPGDRSWSARAAPVAGVDVRAAFSARNLSLSKVSLFEDWPLGGGLKPGLVCAQSRVEKLRRIPSPALLRLQVSLSFSKRARAESFAFKLGEEAMHTDGMDSQVGRGDLVAGRKEKWKSSMRHADGAAAVAGLAVGRLLSSLPPSPPPPRSSARYPVNRDTFGTFSMRPFATAAAVLAAASTALAQASSA